MRWWDGTRWGARWTEQTAPAAEPGGWSPGPVAEPTRPGTTLWAVASLVLGIIGGAVLAIIFGFVARSKIKRSGGALRGKGLATAGIVLGFGWVALIALVIVLVATGVLAEDTNAERFSGREKPVAQAVDELETALQADEDQRACDELLTPAYKTRLTAGAGKPCAEVFGEEEGHQVELKVQRILFEGFRATAFVKEAGDDVKIVYTRLDGRWLVDDID